jgi:signal transduction histidine kinase
MTIKTKLILGALIEAFLVLIVSVLLVYSSLQATQARYDASHSTQIVDTISQIRFVTFEHLLHHDQRTYEQWQAKHAELQDLLKPATDADQATRSSLNAIKALSQDVGTLFAQLTVSDQALLANQATTNEHMLQERLASQLLIKQQSQITEALKLAAHTQQVVTDFNDISNLLVLSVIAVMLLITAANYVLTTRTIARSLAALQTGAEMIAMGNFSYRIPLHTHQDEFGKVSEAFNTMAASAGAIDREKTEFILLASHQLRTPLTAIKWYAEALAKHTNTLGKSRLGQYAKQIFDSNNRMITLVDKLLDAARVEAGTLHSQPALVDIQEVLDHALEDIQAKIRNNKIHIHKKIDSHLPAIFIDPSWLEVIFENLLSNAARYSREGKTVEVSIEKQDKYALIQVVDSGYGIPADQRKKIFTKLFRADNAKQIIGEGSGLDLYITKAMVERTGGIIWFTSVEGQGTTFFVKLPLHTTHGAIKADTTHSLTEDTP